MIIGYLKTPDPFLKVSDHTGKPSKVSSYLILMGYIKFPTKKFYSVFRWSFDNQTKQSIRKTFCLTDLKSKKLRIKL